MSIVRKQFARHGAAAVAAAGTLALAGCATSADPEPAPSLKVVVKDPPLKEMGNCTYDCTSDGTLIECCDDLEADGSGNPGVNCVGAGGCGRPLFVNGVARIAEVTERDDWA